MKIKRYFVLPTIINLYRHVFWMHYLLRIECFVKHFNFTTKNGLSIKFKILVFFCGYYSCIWCFVQVYSRCYFLVYTFSCVLCNASVVTAFDLKGLYECIQISKERGLKYNTIKSFTLKYTNTWNKFRLIIFFFKYVAFKLTKPFTTLKNLWRSLDLLSLDLTNP